MSDTMLWIALAGGEVLTVLIVLLSVSWFRHRAQRIRDAKAIKEFVAGVQNDRVAREVTIRSFLADNYGLADGELDKMAIPIVREEMRLYQTFANLYLRRDTAEVKAFRLAFEAAAAPYWSLEGSVGGDASVAPKGGDSDVTIETTLDDGELDRLRSENEDLQTELQITMSTISRMLNEYSAMFGGDSAELAPAVANDASASSGADSALVDSNVSLDDDLDLMADEASDFAIPTDQAHAPSNDSGTSDEELDPPIDAGLAHKQTSVMDGDKERTEASLDDLDTTSEVIDLSAEADGADAIELGTDAESGDHKPLSDTDPDELLADALGDAGLALDGLDDLFDGIVDDELDQRSSDAGDDEKGESVAI